MHKRSSWAYTATVRKCSSVPARKIRTAISLRLAAISFLIGRITLPLPTWGTVSAREEPAEDGGVLVLAAEERVRGIWAKPAGLNASCAKGKTQVVSRPLCGLLR